MGITRQVLNVHFRGLKDEGYIRAGRGFIEITEKGMKALGNATAPTFIFAKVSPQKRAEAYKVICELPAQRIFRVAGEMDLLIITDQDG